MTNIALIDQSPTYRVREERGDYGVDAVDHAKELYEAQGLIDAALNLVGLLLAALEDAGDEKLFRAHAGSESIASS